MFIDRKFHYIVFILAFCFRVFWNVKLNINSTDWIDISNCLLGSVVVLFIYLISKELFSKRTGQIASILYSINIFASAYCSVPTNQHAFAALVLMSTHLLISKKYMNINYIVKYVIVALCIGVASILRTEVIIYLLAVVIYLFANSLVKDNGKKEKLIGIVVLIFIYVLVNVLVLGLVKTGGINEDRTVTLAEYKEMFEDSEKSIEQFELNSKEFWNDIDYTFMGNIKIGKIRTYDSVMLLFCTICSAIIVIYCKMKNIEDERMYLFYLIILINFFVYGFVKDNSVYSYVSRIVIYILASGGLAIFKRNAEIEALEKYNIKLLQE